MQKASWIYSSRGGGQVEEEDPPQRALERGGGLRVLRERCGPLPSEWLPGMDPLSRTLRREKLPSRFPSPPLPAHPHHPQSPSSHF